MNSPVVKLLAVLTGVGVFFGGAYLVRQQLGIEITQESLRSYVDAMGPLAPVIFVAAVALRWVLAIPSALILTVGGAVFGVTLGSRKLSEAEGRVLKLLSGLMLLGLGIVLVVDPALLQQPRVAVGLLAAAVAGTGAAVGMERLRRRSREG